MAWGTWLARTLPEDAEADGGLMAAVTQLAISLGALTGGPVFDAAGPLAERSPPLLPPYSAAARSRVMPDADHHLATSDPHRTKENPMRATLMHGRHDVRIEDVPDTTIQEATDALVRVTRACICGSDL